MNINDLGKFRIGGSINTQFQTDLAIERVLIGMGQQAGGITSFLTTLEFIGYILLIFWSLFFITLILTIYFLLFLIGVYKSITGRKGKSSEPEMSDEEIEKALNKLTDEDIEEANNFY